MSEKQNPVTETGYVGGVNPAMDKRRLRGQILAIRNEMPTKMRENKDRVIFQKLINDKWYQEAKIILAYVEYQSEAAVTPLIRKALTEEKQIFVPRVSGDEMEFYRIFELETLREGYKGIREPVSGQAFTKDTIFHEKNRINVTENTECIEHSEKDIPILMLMPGVVFDRERHRIGYGKGFYDKYIKRLVERKIAVNTLALCYECQMLSRIPCEEHDIRPDAIVTEERFYR